MLQRQQNFVCDNIIFNKNKHRMIVLRPYVTAHMRDAIITAAALYIDPSGKAPLSKKIQEIDYLFIICLRVGYE